MRVYMVKKKSGEKNMYKKRINCSLIAMKRTSRYCLIDEKMRVSYILNLTKKLILIHE